MEHRIIELTDHHKKNKNINDNEEEKKEEEITNQRKRNIALKERVSNLETQVTALGAERQRLVHALETAKGHIIKLTSRLSESNNSNSSSISGGLNDPETITRAYVKASLESIAPGELERQIKLDEEKEQMLFKSETIFGGNTRKAANKDHRFLTLSLDKTLTYS